MSAWALGAWRTGAWSGTAWASDDSEPQVSVPNVVGLTQSLANSTIVSAGLLFSASTAYSDTIAAGLVISQSPTVSTLVDSGSLVTVVISLGTQDLALRLSRTILRVRA